MDTKVLLLMCRLTLIWVGLLVIAVVNGAFRELVLASLVGEPWAHYCSAAIVMVLFAVYIGTVWSMIGIRSHAAAALIGIYWLGLTFVTETVVIGRLIGGRSWQQLFSAYNPLHGDLWIFVLSWVGILPALIFFVRSMYGSVKCDDRAVHEQNPAWDRAARDAGRGAAADAGS